MKKLNLTLKCLMSLVILAAMLVFTGCGSDDGDGTPAPTQNAMEIIESSDNLSLFEAELKAAGLDASIRTSSETTVFAPSNDALETLLGTLSLEDFSLVSEAVTQAVLSFHIANSQILASEIVDGSTITTAQGEQITVVGGPKLNSGATSDAGFVTTDIQATNGVVHIVDVVLVPPSIGALIVQTLGSVAQPILLGGDFTTLASAMQKADVYASTEGIPTLIATLSESSGDFTVFAPTNGVFTQGGLTVESFTGAEWYGILSHHIVAGAVLSSESDFTAGQTISTLATATTTLELTVLTTDAPTDPEAGIVTGIVLDSNGDTTPEGQIAVLNAATAGNGTVHAFAGVLSPQ